MPQQLFLALGYLGAAIGVAMVMPQVVRVLRHPALAGVSPLSWGITATACTTWFMYGVRTGQPVQLFGNALLITGAVVVAVCASSPAPWQRRGAAVVGAMGAAVGLGLLLPPAAVGLSAFALGLVSTWPQVAASVATYRRREVSAVSVGTFGLKIASQACWLAFAVGTHERTVMVSAVVALSAAALVVGLETTARTLARRPALAGA